MSVKWLLLPPFLFIFLIHFAAFSTLTHTAATTQTMSDHLALLDIKSMITNDSQGVMTSWNHSNTDFCNWEGVACGTRHQRVTSLDLTGRGLIGTVSPSIGNLSFLTAIYLYNNSFSGEIPAEIGRLFRLKELYLSRNSFTGNIPPTIMNCSDLQVLELGSNNLTGKIPDGIGSLSMLYSVGVGDNILEGRIPPSIANLTLLQTLDLNKCQLAGTLPDVFQSLIILLLSGNYLTGTIPRSLFNISSLHYVDLHDNHINGTLTSSRVLDMGGNLNKSFWRLPPKLSFLDMSKNHLKGTINWLEIPETLYVIDLSSNEFERSLHQLLCFNGEKGTVALNLGNNHFSGVIPTCWEKWPSLTILNLQGNKLSGEIPKTLGLPSLQVLQLDRNKLVGSIPTWIGTQLNQLRILNLRSNNLTGNIPHELCYLSHTKILDLANNNLSGNIPRCFNNFSVLPGKETDLTVQISTYFNQFVASDSLVIKGREDTYKEILGLVMLLDLSNNNFFGQYPSAYHPYEFANIEFIKKSIGWKDSRHDWRN